MSQISRTRNNHLTTVLSSDILRGMEFTTFWLEGSTAFGLRESEGGWNVYTKIGSRWFRAMTIPWEIITEMGQSIRAKEQGLGKV